MDNRIVIFDLDDTLYQEIDFLKSAFQEIAQILSSEVKVSKKTLYTYMIQCYNDGKDAFQSVIDTYHIHHLTVIHLLNMYRNHYPNIHLSKDTVESLNIIKETSYKVGLITDGREIQQRNKLNALGLQNYFDGIVISETFGSSKPDARNFKYYETLFGDQYNYTYIGDNTSKDFVAPNSLGWTTICLKDKGLNIHKQSFKEDHSKQPHFIINALTELQSLLLQKPMNQ